MGLALLCWVSLFWRFIIGAEFVFVITRAGASLLVFASFPLFYTWIGDIIVFFLCDAREIKKNVCKIG